MGTLAAGSGTTEYRGVLIQPESHGVLAFAAAGSFRLPRVSILAMSRPARELQRAIRDTWGIAAFILDTCVAPHGASPCAVAELRSSGISGDLEEVALDRIIGSDLTSEERHDCQLLFEGQSTLPVARMGWINEAINWVASVTGRRFSTENDVEQLNAGGGFVLLRLRTDDGRSYWLKATGVPNMHELSITSCLSGLYPDFLPKLVAIRNDWNAWLAEDAGKQLSDPPADAVFIRAVRSFASLQIQTIGTVDVLLAAGAFDQRIPVVRRHLDDVAAFLIDAMTRQTTAKVAPLSRHRVLELGEILGDALCQVEALGIPDMLIHNDLNLGNILSDGTNCVFTDWSEAAVGNPFLSFERFRLLNRDAEGELRRVYGEVWREYLSQASIDRACQLMPLLSIFACLYGRGDWLVDTGKITPQFESYARSLARHMDRAAKNPELREALCR
jgi:hypothetical protein